MKKSIILFGCGAFAEKHVNEIVKWWPEAVIGCMVDPTHYQREKLAQTYYQQTGYLPFHCEDWREFSEAGQKWDAAVVVTPPHTHFVIAKEMIQLEKPVYIEKPMTSESFQAELLVAYAREKNVDITVGANRCVFPAYRTAATALREGEIGNLKAISVYYKHTWERNTKSWRKMSDSLDAGLLADHSPHYSHYLVTDLGFFPERVIHVGTRYDAAGVDVDVCYQLVDKSGVKALVVLDGSPSYDQREEEFRIYGTEGMLLVKFENGTSNTYLEREGRTVRLDISRAVGEIKALGISDPASHPALIHNFLSVLCGKASENGNPGMTGYIPVRITNAIQILRLRNPQTLSKQEIHALSAMTKKPEWIDVCLGGDHCRL